MVETGDLWVCEGIESSAMAEPVRLAGKRRLQEDGDPERAPLDAADFPGCRAVRIAPEEIEDYDGRLEYWEARTATAMVLCEPTSFHREQPSQRLARLAERIAASRGSPIETFGTADLVRRDARGKPRVWLPSDARPINWEVPERSYGHQWWP